MTSNTTVEQSLRSYIFDKLYSRGLKLSIEALAHLEKELDALESLGISKELMLLDRAIHLARKHGGYYNWLLNHAVWAYVLGLIGVNLYDYGLTERTEPVEYIDFGVATSPASCTILEQCMKELGLSDISEEGEEFWG